jgi:hypothetical protein
MVEGFCVIRTWNALQYYMELVNFSLFKILFFFFSLKKKLCGMKFHYKESRKIHLVFLNLHSLTLIPPNFKKYHSTSSNYHSTIVKHHLLAFFVKLDEKCVMWWKILTEGGNGNEVVVEWDWVSLFKFWSFEGISTK